VVIASSLARRSVVAVVASLVGLALLVWQIRRVGLTTIEAGLAQVGAAFLAILALAFLRFVLRALAWTTLIGDDVSVGAALAATVSGDALGNITPFSLFVSEPAKALYLRSGIPASRALAALAAENFFYSLSVAVFIILGTIALLAKFAVPESVRTAGALSLALMVSVVAGALWMVWREPAVVSSVLARVPLLKLSALVGRVRDFETRTYAFVRQSRGRLGVVGGCEVSFHLLSFAESYLTLRLITGLSLPLEAFVLDTVNRIINVMFRMVPFKVGVDEFGSELVSRAIGLAPGAGTTLALVRKGRLLVWAAVGLGLLLRRGFQNGTGQRAKR
jgi:hypothetical protein